MGGGGPMIPRKKVLGEDGLPRSFQRPSNTLTTFRNEQLHLDKQLFSGARRFRNGVCGWYLTA